MYYTKKYYNVYVVIYINIEITGSIYITSQQNTIKAIKICLKITFYNDNVLVSGSLRLIF